MQKPRYKETKNTFVLFLFCCSILLVSPFILRSATLGGIGIRPSDNGTDRNWFIYNLGPSETSRDFIMVENISDEVKIVILSAVDSRQDQGGAFELKGADEKQEDIGQWIRLDTEELTLQSGQSVEVGFTITIPHDVDVGEHSGAITIENKNLSERSPFVNTRIGVRVYNTVPGQIEYTADPVSFIFHKNWDVYTSAVTLGIKNNSNASFRLLVKLETGGWGIVRSSTGYFDRFFPALFEKEFQLARGQEIQTSWLLPQPFLGRLRFRATAAHTETGGSARNEEIIFQTDDLAILAAPWTYLGWIIGLLVVVFGAIVGLVYMRRKIRIARGWEPYKVQPSDNIITLAQKYNIQWEELASVNHIKKPYALSPGKFILIPSPMKQDNKTYKNQEEEERVSSSRFSRMLLMILVVILGTVLLALTVLIFKFVSKSPDQRDAVITPTVTEQVVEQKEEITRETVLPQSDAVREDSESAEAPAGNESQEADESQEVVLAKEPIDRAVVTVSVLNGSGISGLAGKISEKLKIGGFVKTAAGNADNYEYKNLAIIYKQGFEFSANEIAELLKADYPTVDIKQGELEDADVVAILGAVDIR